MKRNAIIRILLWSIALVVLLAILFLVVFGTTAHTAYETPAETVVVIPMVTSPADIASGNAITISDLNVRRTPDTDAEVVGLAEKGTVLNILRQEQIGSIRWGYIGAPVMGWIAMDYVELLEPVAEEHTDVLVTIPPETEITGYGVSLDASNIHDMEIEWAAGTISIQPMDIHEIRIEEYGPRQDKEPMVWNVRNDKLFIQYSEKMSHFFGVGLTFGKEAYKDLIIQVPLDWECRSLEVDAAEASLEISGLTIREMEFDGASGTCLFDQCTVEKLNLDTASGDLDITLPGYAGFQVTLETLSGRFESDFDAVSRNGSYVWGDGKCRIDVDAMSGDVIVRKGF